MGFYAWSLGPSKKEGDESNPGGTQNLERHGQRHRSISNSKNKLREAECLCSTPRREKAVPLGPASEYRQLPGISS